MMARATAFSPEDADVLRRAFQLAKRTFENQRRLAKAEEEEIARAVIQVASAEGCEESDRLAARAVLRAVTQSSSPGRRARRPTL